ncbi:uncharacterized protein [Periplaneta americana]|uniref:uncharacterized protein isoform X2 n=1 Tax=Periplaneta americana TaxID=6978 RepID=UPI0037E9A63D
MSSCTFYLQLVRLGECANVATACRDKWTSLRCVYRRIVNQQASAKTKRKIKWPWANMMTFLIPHLKTIQPRFGPDIEIDDTESVITINDQKAYGTHEDQYINVSNYSEDFELEGVVNSEDGVAEYLYDDTSDTDIIESESVNNHSAKRVKLEDSSSHSRHVNSVKSSQSNCRTQQIEDFLKFIQTPGYSTSKPANPPIVQQYDQLAGADADEMFFRSIVPDVKLLNQRDKGTFKLKVQQLLYDMLYPSKDNNHDENGVIAQE